MTYTCTACGETKTEVIEATGHTAVTDEAVAATETKTGLTEGSHCSVCGEILVVQEVIPMLSPEEYTYTEDESGNTAISSYNGEEPVVSIPSELDGTTVTEIGENAFAGTAVTEVEVPATVTKICTCAFANCTELTSITIPSSVTEIAEDAFEGCTDIVIYTESGSAATAYAKAKGIDYILTDGLFGDVNQNQSVDVSDALLILQAYVGLATLDSAQTYAADVDGNGVVDVSDALEVLQYYVGLIQKFSAEN